MGMFLTACLVACTTGPGPSGPPTLPTTLSSASHGYALRAPAGWTATVGASSADPDQISGPDGRITVLLSAIPVGIGRSDWIDSYLDMHAADFPSGCLTGGGAAQEQLSIAGGDGRLIELDCLPGWLLIVAGGDRLYDLRFTPATASAPGAKGLFVAIAQSLTFLPAGTPAP